MRISALEHVALAVVQHEFAVEHNDRLVLLRVSVPGATAAWFDLRLQHGNFLGSHG